MERNEVQSDHTTFFEGLSCSIISVQSSEIRRKMNDENEANWLSLKETISFLNLGSKAEMNKIIAEIPNNGIIKSESDYTIRFFKPSLMNYRNKLSYARVNRK